MRRSYSITSAGTKQLKRWLGPPLPEWAGSVTFDPLRTRMSFLGVLSPAKQESFLLNAEELLVRELKDIRDELGPIRETGSLRDRVTAEGCQAVTVARPRWIRSALEALRQG